jgi:PII-like signaling protein
MQPATPAKILRIYISESDRLGNQPLYEAIVAKCREMKIAGATVLQGHEGYGETGEMHKAHLLKNDRPIAILIVDTAEQIDRLTPAVEQMMETGMMAQSEVKLIRVQKRPAAASGKPM